MEKSQQNCAQGGSSESKSNEVELLLENYSITNVQTEVDCTNRKYTAFVLTDDDNGTTYNGRYDQLVGLLIKDTDNNIVICPKEIRDAILDKIKAKHTNEL